MKHFICSIHRKVKINWIIVWRFCSFNLNNTFYHVWHSIKNGQQPHQSICLFVCLFGVYRSTREFFTHMETSTLPVKGFKFWPMVGTHGYWTGRVFSVPHLLWRGESVYNGHLRGSVTLTPIAERLAVELSLPVFTKYVCLGWYSNTQQFACGSNVVTHCTPAVSPCDPSPQARPGMTKTKL